MELKNQESEVMIRVWVEHQDFEFTMNVGILALALSTRNRRVEVGVGRLTSMRAECIKLKPDPNLVQHAAENELLRERIAQLEAYP